MAKSKREEVKVDDSKPVDNKKPNIFIGIKGERGSFTQSKGDNKFYQGVDPLASEVEKITEPATVISRLDHTITLTYNGDAMLVSPRERKRIADIKKLGAIPKGITVVPEKFN